MDTKVTNRRTISFRFHMLDIISLLIFLFQITVSQSNPALLFPSCLYVGPTAIDPDDPGLPSIDRLIDAGPGPVPPVPPYGTRDFRHEMKESHRSSSYNLFALKVKFLFVSTTPFPSLNNDASQNPRIVEHPTDIYVARGEPATLNCKAEGTPETLVTWYRDGQRIITSKDDPTSPRMLLPNGPLFILSVARGRTGDSVSDVGVYYCNATNPETGVSVISGNASLKIAVIRGEFREQPSSMEISSGQPARLACRPPRGEPEPRVRWLKDDQPLAVSETGRVKMDEQGSLVISEVKREDSGIYICVGFNQGGEKQSNPAHLLVKVKPVILEGPRDVTVQETQDALFQCKATGDPEPVIIWKKLEGTIPAERSRILADRSLRIELVQAQDEGVYVCRMENSAGWEEAEARLTVHARPSFMVTPKDMVVGVGRQVSIRCQVTGNPTPAVFWNKDNSQDHGRFRVTEEGTLLIDRVQPEDAGEYVCQGLSLAGSAYARAKLEVKEVDPRPPPIIHQGPQNQTLPASGVATLPCLATGEPMPAIYWLKNSGTLSLSDPRFNILDSGTLEISDLRRTDTGLYTCKASSETGETSWTAALIVESSTNPSIIFHRTPEPATFPGPPSKPAVSDVTNTSLRLSWAPNVNPGASPVTSYVVEYFSHDTGEGWVVSSDSVTEPMYQVKNLRPSTSYMFLVRARNSHGLSLPSAVTSPIKTLGGANSHRPNFTPSQADLQLARQFLTSQGQLFTMQPPEVLSSSAVKVSWDLMHHSSQSTSTYLKYIEGFNIKFRRVEGQSYSGQGHIHHSPMEFTIRSVSASDSMTYVLSGLDKFCTYEVWVQPYYYGVTGLDSNRVRAQTYEDVPSVPPSGIQATLLHNETLLVTWLPPYPELWNGVPLAYKIYLYGNETKYNREVRVEYPAERHHLRHLLSDMKYRLQMSAANRMGEGPKSEIIFIGQLPGEADTNFLNEPWFIATLIVTIGVTLWILLCFASVYIYRRYHRHPGKKVFISSSGKQGVPLRRTEDTVRSCHAVGTNHIPLLAGSHGDMSGNYANGGGHFERSGTYLEGRTQCCYDNEQHTSVSETDSKTNGSHVCTGHTYQTLDSMGQWPQSNAVPYATTTLVHGANQLLPTGGSIPNPQAYMIQPGSGGSSGSEGENSCVRRGDCQKVPMAQQTGYSSNQGVSGSRAQQPGLYLPPPPLYKYSGGPPHGPRASQSPASGHGGSSGGSKASHAPYHQGHLGNDLQRCYDGQSDRLHDADNHSDFPEDSVNYDDVYEASRRPESPESNYTETERALLRQAWHGASDDDLDGDVESHSEVSNDDGEVSMADRSDFAGAVTRAAERSGLTVIGQSNKDSRTRQKAAVAATHQSKYDRKQTNSIPNRPISNVLQGHVS